MQRSEESYSNNNFCPNFTILAFAKTASLRCKETSIISNMKKTLLLAVCYFGTQAVFAQETETVTEITVTETKTACEKPFEFYVGFGATFVGDYNLNDNLAMANMPQIGSAAPEFTFGFTSVSPNEKLSMDIEGTAAYMDKKDNDNRLKTAIGGVKMRIHYKLAGNNKWFFAAGGDISYVFTQVNLYTRSNTIDLNDLNPATHTGHISMYNQQLTLGPSVSLGFCREMVFPLRLNFGYDIGLSNGKWKSEFADINNTVKENGLSRFYAKLIIDL